jgi:hypothetical protein
MMRRDFARDGEAFCFCRADVIERSARREMRDVETRARERGDFDIAADADGF